MHRPLYFAGIGYLAICGLLVLRHRQAKFSSIPSQPAATGFPADGDTWWVRMKVHCNAVEVELTQRMNPAPPTLTGQGYSAACYALAGKLDSARAVIDRLPESNRYEA